MSNPLDFKEVLEVVSKFTNTIILSPSRSFFSDPEMSFFGSVENNLEQEIGLYDDVADLNRMISLFQSPQISVDGTKIKIQEDNRVAYFMSSDISLIRGNQNFNLEEQLDRTLEAPEVLNFVCTSEIINQIRTAAGTIDNSKVILRVRDIQSPEALEIQIKDVDMLMTDSNSYNFSVAAKAEKEFCVVLGAELFAKMPRGGFEFSLIYSSRANSYRAVFKQENLIIVCPTNLGE